MPDQPLRRDVPAPLRRLAHVLALTALLAALGPIPAVVPGPSGAAHAQSSEGLTVAQVQQRYRRMSEVHILKCDKDGNGLLNRTEMLCVRSIYSAMYLDR